MSVKALAAVAVIGGLVGGGAAIGIQQLAAPHGIQGEAVRAYLLDHPEVIPEAMQRLQDREQGKAVAAIGGDLTKPFGSAYSGNPQGDVTLVEFYDYNCGYCRASLPLLKQLVQADPKLRIVYRELPILAPSSKAAARMSLLAASQGKFRPSTTRCTLAARSATRRSRRRRRLRASIRARWRPSSPRPMPRSRAIWRRPGGSG
ncbi:hypothetical protein SPKIRA_19060 [Sphingomonas paucimobilis]|nr:hypothetical protein SPKIRA_19060 [Sphingomonas paucimobilis]